MFRSLHAITVIFALLICPFRCMGAFADASAEDAAPKCSCCHHASENSSSPEQPMEGSGDCGCASCLCHGAVRGDDGDAQNQSVLYLCFLMIPVEPMAPESVLDGVSVSIENSPPCVSGRTLRIVQQSFLCR
jgi:hypothetical protein